MDIQEQVFFESMQFSYIIRKPKSKSLRPQSVYILFRIGKKQYKINTGAKVLRKNWHNGRLTACNLIDVKNNDILLSFLNKNNLQFEKLKQYLCTYYDNIVNIDAVVSMFFFNFKSEKMPKAKKKENYLSEMLYYTVRAKKEQTKKSYTTYIDTFTKFMTENNIEDVISNGTKDTLIKYQQHLLNKGNSPTGINNRIMVFTTLLRQAAKENKYGYVYDRSIEDIERLKISEHKDNLAETYFTLTNEEINQIYYYKGSNNKPLTPKQEFSKDAFVFECLTGQRVGDCQRLLQDKDLLITESNGIQFISFHDQKTRSQCLIPLYNDIVKDILKKYENNSIDIPTVITTNKNIKEICKRLNMNREVSRTVGNKLVQMPLFEAIHSHVGRHTFVTNMYLSGMSKEEIIKITGHKNTKMIDNIYLNLTRQDKADMLAKSINSMNGKCNGNKQNNNKNVDDKHDDNDNKPNIPNIPTPTSNTNQSNEVLANNEVNSIIQLAKENVELKQELDKFKQPTQNIRNEKGKKKEIEVGIALLIGMMLCVVTHQQLFHALTVLIILFSVAITPKEYILKYI